MEGLVVHTEKVCLNPAIVGKIISGRNGKLFGDIAEEVLKYVQAGNMVYSLAGEGDSPGPELISFACPEIRRYPSRKVFIPCETRERQLLTAKERVMADGLDQIGVCGVVYGLSVQAMHRLLLGKNGLYSYEDAYRSASEALGWSEEKFEHVFHARLNAHIIEELTDKKAMGEYIRRKILDERATQQYHYIMSEPSLEAAVDSLKERYIDCKPCPPARHCCNFSESFGLPLSSAQANHIFGQENISELVSGKKLEVITGDYSYKYTGGKCPRLTKDNLCSLHSRKKELGLDVCRAFPIYIVEEVEREDEPPIKGPLIFVDYRCFAVETDWKTFAAELMRISEEHSVPVYVQCRIDTGVSGALFDVFMKAVEQGGIPPQTL